MPPWNLVLSIDTEKHQINYDLSFVFEGNELLINLELIGQEGCR